MVLADVVHDREVCPFSHNPESKKYIERERCPRLTRLKNGYLSYLKEASELPAAVFSTKSIDTE